MKRFIYKFIKNSKLRLRNFLYTPGREWLGKIVGTLYATIRKGKFSCVFFDNGVWIHKYADGIVTDRHINYSLSFNRYIRDAQNYWTFVYQPKAGDIIIDVGAGKGEDVPFFSHAVGPQGRVIAIEAHPETFRCLAALCAYNNLNNVTPIQAAICEKEGEIMIDNPDSDIMSSIANATDGFKVNGYTLDKIFEKFNLDKVDFLKMNIEGAEKMAIQ